MFIKLALVLQFIFFQLPNVGYANYNCSRIYNLENIHQASESVLSQEISAENLAKLEIKEQELSEAAWKVIDQINESLNQPMGAISASDILFSQVANWLKKSGEVIRSNTQVFAEAKEANTHAQLQKLTIKNNNWLANLGHLVAKNKSLKYKFLQFFPKFQERKIEKLSQQIRYGSGKIEELLSQLKKESETFSNLSVELKSEINKIEDSYKIISQLRDYYQEILWGFEKSTQHQNKEHIENIRLLLFNLDNELKNLISLQTLSTTLLESVNSQLKWNHQIQMRARDVLYRTPLMVTGVSERPLNLSPEAAPEERIVKKVRSGNSHKVEIKKQSNLSKNAYRVIKFITVGMAAFIIYGYISESEAYLAEYTDGDKVIDLQIFTPVMKNLKNEELLHNGDIAFSEMKKTAKIDMVIAKMKYELTHVTSASEMISILSYGVQNPSRAYQNAVSNLWRESMPLFESLNPTPEERKILKDLRVL
jgi:hypothetical protein